MLDPPPQLARNTTLVSAVANAPARKGDFRIGISVEAHANPSSASHISGPGLGGGRLPPRNWAIVGAVVVTVILKLTISEPNRNTGDGIEHFARRGAPEQVTDTLPRKPFRDETCTG